MKESEENWLIKVARILYSSPRLRPLYPTRRGRVIVMLALEIKGQRKLEKIGH